MRVVIPCDCADEEHEIHVATEVGMSGRVGYYGPGKGDALPCGRLMTAADVDEIFERLEYDPSREEVPGE